MEIAGIKGLTVKVHDSDLTTSPADLVGFISTRSITSYQAMSLKGLRVTRCYLSCSSLCSYSLAVVVLYQTGKLHEAVGYGSW